MTSKLVLDREVAPHLGVSRSFLQKRARITRQLIPFYRIGGRVLYDPHRHARRWSPIASGDRSSGGQREPPPPRARRRPAADPSPAQAAP